MNNTIVITYKGNAPSESVIKEMLKALSESQSNNVPGTVFVFDEEDVAKAMSVIATQKLGTARSTILLKNRTAEDEAAIFIGNKYVNYIGTRPNVFAMNLSADYWVAKIAKSRANATPHQLALLSAVETLGSKPQLRISESVLEKYNITKPVLEYICNLYKSDK